VKLLVEADLGNHLERNAVLIIELQAAFVGANKFHTGLK
jgi:hypothetical protein